MRDRNKTPGFVRPGVFLYGCCDELFPNVLTAAGSVLFYGKTSL
jgi:hypothetical protein